MQSAFGAAGVILVVVGFYTSTRVSIYPQSNFWTSSPSFFFLRTGLMTLTIAVAYAWERRPSAGKRWSPLRLLGQTSLFIYWIHVEMVYGLISTPLHGALTLRQAWAALGVFCLFMLLCASIKVRVANWWKRDGWAVAFRRHSSHRAQKQA